MDLTDPNYIASRIYCSDTRQRRFGKRPSSSIIGIAAVG